MNLQELKNIAHDLMAGNKGLLAMDESIATCNKRFKALNIPETEVYRRKYRELIVTAPRLEEYISGAILFDETIKQTTEDGTLFIDILKKIAKWRAVITIGDHIPTNACIKANAYLLARYAVLCQEAGLVPIVEPEVLMDGDHSLRRCAEVTHEVLHTVFNELYQQRVHFEGMILKPNMILPGLNCPVQDDVATVADATITCFLKCVPAAVPGIAFLSGGQSPELATERLNAMHVRFNGRMPWALTFSFSRAVQQPALEQWGGNDSNIAAAQLLLVKQAALNSAARAGKYTGV